MKRWATWGLVAFAVLEMGGAIAILTNRTLARTMWQWLWENVAPVLDRLTGIR